MLIDLLNVCRYGAGVFRDSFFIRVSWGDWISGVIGFLSLALILILFCWIGGRLLS